MPKVVDHTERRRLIARAFGELVAGGGLAAATYVRVAKAAGVSVGAVQHYFPSRDALVQFVLADLLAAREARVGALVAELEAAGQPLRRIVGLALAELLPLDAERRREHVVEEQLRAQAWAEPALAGPLAAGREHVHRRVTGAVENGKRCGEVAAGLDAGRAATTILATTTGLARLLADQDGVRLSVAEVTEVLDPVLGLVFSGRCHHYR